MALQQASAAQLLHEKNSLMARIHAVATMSGRNLKKILIAVNHPCLGRRTSVASMLNFGGEKSSILGR